MGLEHPNPNLIEVGIPVLEVPRRLAKGDDDDDCSHINAFLNSIYLLG